MIADTLAALSILDEGGVPHCPRPQSQPGDPTPIYDELVAENVAVIAARQMCTEALRSRSKNERLLAASLLVVLDEPADLRVSA